MADPKMHKYHSTEAGSYFFNEWYCENGLSLELISDCENTKPGKLIIKMPSTV